MGNELCRKIKKHTIILTITCGFACLFLYALGYFISLHPHAYRDLIRSIVLVYGIYILVHGLFTVVLRKIPALEARIKNSYRLGGEGPAGEIAIAFTIITAINSIMMVTGHDTPKEGVFAYVHMMTRLLIISCIMIIWKWKDVIDRSRRFEFKNKLRMFYQEAHKRVLGSASKIFTVVTAAYCLMMIVFQRALEPAGGILFYQTLLGIIIASVLYMTALRSIRNS